MSYHKEFKHDSSNVWEAIGIKESLLKETTDIAHNLFDKINKPSMFIEALETTITKRPELLRPMLVIVAGALAKQHFEMKEKLTMIQALGGVLKDLVDKVQLEDEPEQEENIENKDNLH